MKKSISAIAVMILFTISSFGQKSYTLDKYHSKVGFSATHFGISHIEGNFKMIDATLQAKKGDLTGAEISFTADVNSINTDVEYRDNDLKSVNYFDAAKFPTIIFKSRSFTKVTGKKYKLVGEITIHGVTKPVEFSVLFNGVAVTAMKKPTAGFTITGKINRLDFGVGSAPATSGVSNEIELKSNVEFTVAD